MMFAQTVDAIKAALAEFDTAFKALSDHSDIDTREAYHRQLGKLDILTTTDWLRDLLAEVERLQAIERAARELLDDKQYRRIMGDGTFIWHECIFCSARLDHRHKDDCPMKALQTALGEGKA